MGLNMTATPQLRLYNTLTRKKEVFEPIDVNDVRMYVCGPTVYDFAHIGNARPVIVFDILYRLLGHLYGENAVTYVRNITDVDDKINARALRDFPNLPLNEAIRNVTQKTTGQFHADVKALGCLEPSFEPRATDHIEGMVKMIGVLIDKGNAYQAGGEVLFDVSSMADYGRLSNRKLEDQQAGARIATSSHKKNPGDFVLWKLSSADEPGWESPWGVGRPGWHIECSVMANFHLGETFDIHGGGLDLIFPHHENEIAQSRCAHNNDKMASIWMHNGYLQVEGRKMSKSEGNFVTIKQVLDRDLPMAIPASSQLDEGEVKTTWNGLVARISMMKSNYREPTNWTEERTAHSHLLLESWYDELRAAKFDVNAPLNNIKEVVEALSNDLNTCDAITVLHSFAKGRDSDKLGQAMNLLGLIDKNFIETKIQFFPQKTGLKDDEINQAIDLRLTHIKNKDWPSADTIRDELLAQGVQLKDSKNPQTGERITSWELKR